MGLPYGGDDLSVVAPREAGVVAEEVVAEEVVAEEVVAEEVVAEEVVAEEIGEGLAPDGRSS